MSALPQSVLLRKHSPTPASVDPIVCWQALRSRDPRFDGRFFAGVVTTNIYCRTICPVPLKKPENIRWFATAEEADGAGLRPCKRCNPQISPDAAAWRGTGAVVSRALKLVLDGDLDSNGVDSLADRVGMGPRHLRRLFVQHVGTSPLKIAQMRRAYAASSLLAKRNLPLSDVAFRAGFKSVRQFNEVMQATFGASPSQLRHGVTNLSVAAPDGGIELHLSYRPPLHAASLMAFLKQRAIPAVEKIEHDVYRRTIEVDGEIGELEIRFDDRRPRIKVRVKLRRHTLLVTVVERVRRMFDVGADPIRISNHLSVDSRLEELVRSRSGLRIPGAWHGFETAVKAILGESLTVAVSPKQVTKLVETFGQQVRSVGDLSHLFPTPAALAHADLELVGIQGPEAIAIRALAESICGGQIDLEDSNEPAETISRLKGTPGIDESTASYIAMRALGDPDTFALAPRELGFLRATAPWTKFLTTAERWRPWRSYAALYLARNL